MKGTLYTVEAVSGVVRIVATTDGASFTLEQLQSVVGGYIETVPGFDVFPNGQACVAFCNEEGKLSRLPVNERATLMWAHALRRTNKRGALHDVLVGNVAVITGDKELFDAL